MMANPLAEALLKLLSAVTAPPEHMGVFHHDLIGPMLGNLLVGGAAGLVTVACFVVALRLLIDPGEHDRGHPKYRVLAEDR
jgi:hypothetical protein